MELGDLILVAQSAMDHGDYRGAAAACTHAIETFPSCLTAFRMLGEANLERGEIDLAIEQFDRTLDLDPLNVVARLGMGVAYEEKKDYGSAYASYLHAWEINPALEQVRDELVRLRGVLRSEDRVHPTRPGLAGIHARSGQFGRAATEWRAILAVEPGSVRARTAMAEVLWRGGDDVAAAAACKEALRATPENARALGMLADIEQRRGGGQTNELIERYQAVDPQGEVAMILAEWRDELDLQFLRRTSSMLPDFDAAQSAAIERDVFAPSAIAPKVGLTPSHSGAPDLWDSLVQDLRGDGLPLPYDQSGYTAPSSVEPFAWQDDGTAPLTNGTGDPRIAGSDWLAAPASATTTTTANDLDDYDDLAALFASGDSIKTTPPTPIAETGSLAPSAAMQATAGAGAAITPPRQREVKAALPPIVDPFVTADGRVDLTVGWDDLDRKLREATPSFDGGHEYDSLLAELGVDGLAPFVAEDDTFDAGAWAPFTDDDINTPIVAASSAHASVVAASSPVFHVEHEPVHNDLAAYFSSDGSASAADVDDAALESDERNAGWHDDDLLSSIPAASASGYTELLRHVDIDNSVDFDALPQNGTHPFAGPDAIGQPLGFDELLAVTSRDGTAPLNDLFEMPGALNLEEAPENAGWAAETIIGDLPTVDVGQVAFETTLAAGAATGSASGSGAFADLDLAFAGRADLRPFSLDDIAQDDASTSSESMDFSEIDDAMYDPAKYAAPSPSTAADAAAHANLPPMAWSLNGGGKSGAETPGVETVTEITDSLWSEIAASKSSASRPAVSAPVSESPVSDLAGSAAEAAGTLVEWPSFVNHSSELIDRQVASDSLFERLRRGKRISVEAGETNVNRTIHAFQTNASTGPAGPSAARSGWNAPAGSFGVGSGSVAAPDRNSRTPAQTPSTFIPIFDSEGDKGDANRVSLMSLRIRLIEDDNAALEISQVLESSIGLGQNGADPLALRVLGEAYLKLGRPEQAAAQFRQAMLARGRGR